MGIENYFQSDDFVKALSPLKFIFEKQGLSVNSDFIEYFVGLSIQYSLLFSDDTDFSGLNEFLRDVATYVSNMDFKDTYILLGSHSALKEYVSNLCVERLLAKLNITKESLKNEDLNRSVCSLIIRNLKGKGFKFHAFNSALYDSIRENGINPNIQFTSQSEIDKINQIFENYGIRMVFGWRNLNCNGKVSFSETPFVSYYYGINSPEWFSQFTGQGFPFNPSDEYKKGSFVEGDYDAARHNLETLMNKFHFSSDDFNDVIRFFEVNWEKYANKNPMLAMIPDKFSEENTADWLTVFLSDSYYTSDIARLCETCFFGGIRDYQTSETIDVEDAIFVELPNYKQFIHKMCFQQVGEQEYSSVQLDDEALYQKLMFLSQAKIKVRVGTSGKDGWVSEHGEKEVETVNEILGDNEVYRAIVSHKFEDIPFLDSWIGYFDSEIINDQDNIKLLAKQNPVYMNFVSAENRDDISLMRECASQTGIHPILTCYVGESVQNDFEFISNLIMNSDEDTFDFYVDGMEKSNLRYEQFIGFDVRSNPAFWSLLNSKIMSINENTTRNIALFDVQKELDLVNNESVFREIPSDIGSKDDSSSNLLHPKM